MTHTTATLVRLIFVLGFSSIVVLRITSFLSSEWLLVFVLLWILVVNRIATSVWLDASNNLDDYPYFVDKLNSPINLWSYVFVVLAVGSYLEVFSTREDQIVQIAIVGLIIAYVSIGSRLRALVENKSSFDGMVRRHIFKK